MKNWIRMAAVGAAVSLATVGVVMPVQAAKRRAYTATVRVMPLGDSITAGVGSTSGDGYRASLYNRLTNGGLPVNFVGTQLYGTVGTDRNNEGHGGYTIDQLRAGIDGWLDAQYPDVVLLQAGTNDMVRGPVAGAPQRLSYLIADIQSWGSRNGKPVRIFVAKIPHHGSVSDRAYPPDQRAVYNANVDDFNAAVASIVAARQAGGGRVYLADNSQIGGVIIFDGVHPNEAGYSWMSWKWYTSIAQVYGLPAQSAPYGPGTTMNMAHSLDGYRVWSRWYWGSSGWVRTS